MHYKFWGNHQKNETQCVTMMAATRELPIKGGRKEKRTAGNTTKKNQRANGRVMVNKYIRSLTKC